MVNDDNNAPALNASNSTILRDITNEQRVASKDIRKFKCTLCANKYYSEEARKRHTERYHRSNNVSWHSKCCKKTFKRENGKIFHEIKCKTGDQSLKRKIVVDENVGPQTKKTRQEVHEVHEVQLGEGASENVEQKNLNSCHHP